jgi:hypothetical protein
VDEAKEGEEEEEEGKKEEEKEYTQCFVSRARACIRNNYKLM